MLTSLEEAMAAMSAIARTGCAVLVACFIAGCHGGGDGSDTSSSGTGGQQFIVSPSNLGFSAPQTASSPPPVRTVLATVSGPTTGTLFARVVVSNPPVVTVDSVQVLGPTQVRLTFRPVSPAALGVGRHAGVITVIACHTDPNCSAAQIGGSPATINVAYQVGVVTPPPESLAPSVGAAGVSGDVVLRGSGLASVTSVSFGATPAVDFTAMSDSELRAPSPPLAAGTLPISLNSGVGPVPFSQSLTLIPAGTLAAATLAYSTPPQNMRGLAFDPVTQTLFVGAGFSSATSNQVLGYTFAAGAWQLPQSATVQNLRNLALSVDRAHLLAITDTSAVDLSPATLVQQVTPPTSRTTDANTSLDSFLKGIVATNDGQAFIVSSSTTRPGQHWLYNIAAHTFSGPFNSYSFPEIGGPDNGTRAVLVQSGVATAVQQYRAFTGDVTPTPLVLAHF